LAIIDPAPREDSWCGKGRKIKTLAQFVHLIGKLQAG